MFTSHSSAGARTGEGENIVCNNNAVGIPTLGAYTDVGMVKSAMDKPLLE